MAGSHQPPYVRRERSSRRKSSTPSIPLCLFIQRLGESLSLDLPVFASDDDLADNLSVHGSRDSSLSYLLHEIVSKYSTASTGAAAKAAAMEKFELAEERCRQTNELFWSGRVRHSPHLHVLQRAREQIHRLIGDAPDLREVAKYFGWGPGATTRLSRRGADAAYKYSGKPDTTAGNLVHASAAYCSIPSWKGRVSLAECLSGDAFNVVEGNKIITVPKNRKIDRVIAVEPDMNMYVQKGFGGVIRERLREWGINLLDQRPNQRLALAGSVDGSFATMDLSMASDTISRALVEYMLPPEWVRHLEQVRSPVGFFEGRRIRYAKFSSMGNGFTFDLETLIFASLARACYRVLKIDGRPIVYGDDIVVATGAYELLSHVLDTCGFVVNTSKSFAVGSFRESCGKHYLGGLDVTPFYIRRPIKGLEEILLLHNNLWRWASRTGHLDEVGALLTWLRSHAPCWLQKQSLPDGYGDGCFVDGTIVPYARRHPYQWDVYTYHFWARSSSEVETDVPGLLTKALGLQSEEPPWSFSGVSAIKRLDDCPLATVFPVATGGYGRRKALVNCSPHRTLGGSFR